MLNNLKSELVRAGFNPVNAIMEAINCTDNTARNKLNGVTPITMPEALKITSKYFSNGNVDMGELFKDVTHKQEK